MKAKLIKNPSEHYYLIVDKVPQFDYITEPLTGGFVIASSSESELFKLSLKNCQAIELDYDLEDLATDAADNYDSSGNWHVAYELFKEGFQKALEVNSDKRFTLKEMVECWNRALEFQTHKETLGEHIKSLKQTEWDVELEMEFVGRGKHGIGSEVNHYMPKRDADGCLILKRI